MKSPLDYRRNLPLVALIAANTVPLWGVLFAGWDAFYIVLLYWSENLVVGFYNILKIAFLKVEEPKEHLGKLFAIPFFMVHFGGFTAVHGVFVMTMFDKGNDRFLHADSWPCFLVFVQMFLNLIKEAYLIMPVNMRLGLLALFASHGVSFVQNYLIKGEYATVKPAKLMSAPYARVFVMHIAIIAGGFLLVGMGSPLGLLVVLVALKTVIDIKLHQSEHKEEGGRKKASGG